MRSELYSSHCKNATTANLHTTQKYGMIHAVEARRSYETDCASDRPSTGLRERKKVQTRETIRAVALELFDRHGFASTTIAEIAEAANVSPRTVSSYFPAKEDLVLSGYAEIFEHLDAKLQGLGEGETMADGLRAWLADEAPQWLFDESAKRPQSIVRSDPQLQAYERQLAARAEEIFARAIAADAGIAPDGLEARMAAAATNAVLEVMGEHRALATEHADLEAVKAEAMELLERALKFIEAGVEALRNDPRPT